jgi:anti-sigma B factor antagonist
MTTDDRAIAQVRRRDGTAMTVDVAGEIDLASAPALRSCLNECLSEGCTYLTLDMTELTFIDSSGLQVLVRVINHLRDNDGRMTLRNPPAIAQKILGITGLTPYLDIVMSDASDRTSQEA